MKSEPVDRITAALYIFYRTSARAWAQLITCTQIVHTTQRLPASLAHRERALQKQNYKVCTHRPHIFFHSAQYKQYSGAGAGVFFSVF